VDKTAGWMFRHGVLDAQPSGAAASRNWSDARDRAPRLICGSPMTAMSVVWLSGRH
jgi:hypothetical protein